MKNKKDLDETVQLMKAHKLINSVLLNIIKFEPTLETTKKFNKLEKSFNLLSNLLGFPNF